MEESINEKKKLKIRKNLAIFLKRHRLKEGITQIKLAAKLDCSISLIKKIESEAVFNLEQTFNQLHGFASLEKLSLSEFIDILEDTPPSKRGFEDWELDVISRLRQTNPAIRKKFVEKILLGKNLAKANRFFRLVSLLSEIEPKHYTLVEKFLTKDVDDKKGKTSTTDSQTLSKPAILG